MHADGDAVIHRLPRYFNGVLASVLERSRCRDPRSVMWGLSMYSVFDAFDWIVSEPEGFEGFEL
jgi:hypothetical protein